MSTVTAIIAEDESNLRQQLRETLRIVWPELEVRAEARDGIEAVEALAAHSPDVMFLDVQMPGLDGLEVARRASGRCHVVFVTAYDNYAVAAFERDALDYVLKPFTQERLADCVRRIRERLHDLPANLDGLVSALAKKLGQRPGYLRWITASQGGETRIITLDHVAYLKSDHKYTLVVTPDHEALIRSPIRELADRLDPDMFWQIHRGIIVNANFIEGVGRTLRGNLEVRVRNRPEALAVSQAYAHRFKQM